MNGLYIVTFFSTIQQSNFQSTKIKKGLRKILINSQN